MVYGRQILSHPRAVVHSCDLLIPTDACLTIGTNTFDEGVV